ncbi:uncharacterized protein LOC111324415 isoform X2 [Stylophora pistillata]|uniref:uncharacterized protein LOC111324415 isoform X2 n=1 Tax=Stylophora pistillata TaxID=50429 RepID=UPI000C03C5B8|nr:uncharacterized protein LOC111324415 isoform X2 [Stylophora pistillata]
MAKGRSFAPSKDKEGNWFSTRGWPRTLDVTKLQEKKVASPPKRFNDKNEGLGRRTFPDRCQHYSNNLIAWKTNNDPRSCYMASHQGLPGDDNSRYRRFPQVHLEGKPGSAPSETTTTKWFKQPDIPYKTPLHVLAITQEPFLSPNKWAYSYRPIWY